MKKIKLILSSIILIALATTILHSCKQFSKVMYVKTVAVSEINATGGNASAIIIDIGESELTAHGYCWSTSPEPTIEDNIIDKGSRESVGDYTATISGMNPGTKYYLRSFISGVEGTVYGEETEITTKALDFTIGSPAQGDVLGLGFSYTISWTANISDKLKIELYQGSSIAETLADETDNTGTYDWTVSNTLSEASDYKIKISSVANSSTTSETGIFSIASEAPPSVSTGEITNINYSSASVSGNINNFGIESSATQHGHCWSTSEYPTVINSKTELGSTNTTSIFSSNLTELTDNTTYYVRAYATNSIGTSYGEQKVFITTIIPTLPIVTTNAVTNISYTTATCGGNVTSGGDEKISGEVKSVTARGVCYSTSQNPDISNDHTTDGSGTGTFISNLTGLTYNTTYYVRAYATNSVGTSYGEQKTFTTLEFDLVEMVLVQGGSFEMGCGTGQSGCGSDETPVHTVTLDDFYISKYEITNQQYADFLNAYGSSNVLSGEYAGQTMIEESSGSYNWGLYNNGGVWEAVAGYENHPVIYVSWYGANEYCLYYGGRLPTEAEWEYAARGGIHYTNYYLYSGSNIINDVAWYNSNSGSTTHPVGTKSPNALGIYDMSGNVWEWCNDWYGAYISDSQTNPQGPSSGSYRVFRGGSWYYSALYCRSADRYSSSPSDRFLDIGFRLSRN